MAHKPPSPRLANRNSSGSLADHFPSLRQIFQRSASQPSHDSHQDFHAAPSPSPVHAQQSSDRQAFGSCTQVLATVVTALFRAINAFATYEEALSPPADASTTRSAKLLYVQLLDAAQRERGEWQGFAADASEHADSAHDEAQRSSKSAMAILAVSTTGMAPSATFALLNELVDVSFRSLRGPLVDADIYAKHKKQHAAQTLSLSIPASLRALLEVRAILNELARDEKLCLFRLLALWHAMATVNEAHDLARTIQDKHHLVFSDCSELDFLTSRRDARHDPLAASLLHILVLYHDVLFSDVEFLLVKQELQLKSASGRLAKPHEVTELANTFFSFSFTAATVRTMAVMAFYALRKRAHQHHHQHHHHNGK
ncbi:hypothetical protein PybrP1_004034 [[Pythium] brassicae (nom. inval.)]|nr:hypothetical protein PybrP1_004034 [[Pythium] brassicae (nom. inval.)]